METKTTIITKLLEFQTTIETIKKDGKNEFFKKPNGKASSYATLPNILSEVKPILNGLKIVITQPIIDGVVFTILTDTESNEEVKSGIALNSALDAQKTGSAITYFRRYTLSSLLSLEIDEDDDGNSASGNNSSAPKTETDNRPWLTEKAYNTALTRIEGGEKDLYQKTLDAFKMKKEYKTKLQEAFNK